MPNAKNQEIVKKLSDKVSKAKSIYFADLKGLKSNDANDLRAKLLEQKAEVAVAKNTLLEIALKEGKHDVEVLQTVLKGQTTAIFSYEDAIAPLKALFDFAKKIDLVKVKAGIVDGKYAGADEVETLSKLPSKEQLIAQVIGTMKSPLTGFVNVLGGTQRKFVYAMAALAKKKEVQQ